MTNTRINNDCPSCTSPGMSIFYAVHQVPVHSVLLLSTREEAVHYPKSDILLGFCRQCGFISNVAFDPTLHEYSAKYEASQGYSPTFNSFQHRLATSLIDRYDLHGKRIIEIGCGQGEFLSLICELGGNTGIGFDPAYVPERSLAGASRGVTFIPDFYSEKYSGCQGDFICCKMTLEHIHQTAEFVRTIRRSIGDRLSTTVFFQVPNARYVFGDIAFWDIYYEHCSYFSPGSLARLFRHTGFDVKNLWTDYDDQYLMIEAGPGSGTGTPPLPLENDWDVLSGDIARFTEQYPQKLLAWKLKIRELKERGRKVALWGGGSKAVSFLTTLGIPADDIELAVDINPHKADTFIAGTGQQIVSPGYLPDYRPDLVIVMNPVYLEDVKRDLAAMRLSPDVISVESVTG